MGRAGSEPKPPRGDHPGTEGRPAPADRLQLPRRAVPRAAARGQGDEIYMEYAAGLRAEIRRKITDGTFSYRAYFPDSPAAADGAEPDRQFLVPSCCWALLDAQLALYEKQAANGSISASTLLGYAKAIKHYLRPRWATRPSTNWRRPTCAPGLPAWASRARRCETA